MRAARWIAALTCLWPLAAAAQEPPAARVLVELASVWQGGGETNGMPATLRLHWEPVLDGAWTRLALSNRMQAPDGKEWHFQAQAFYRVGPDGAISGNWFDSRGRSLPLAGSAEAGIMTIRWGTSESAEQGRSTYRLATDALEITDEVLTKEGAWRVFGRSRLARMP